MKNFGVVRKLSDLNQWLEGQGGTRTQALKYAWWSKEEEPEKSRQMRGTLKQSEKNIERENQEVNANKTNVKEKKLKMELKQYGYRGSGKKAKG